MKNASFWAGIVILLYSLGMFLLSLPLGYTNKTGPGPGFFPLWVSGILVVLSLGYIVVSLKKRKEIIFFKEILPKGKDLINNLSVLAAVLVFMALLDVAGFMSACSILLFIVLVRQYRWHLALGISIFTSVVLFFTFQLLEVPLPVNAFGF